MFIIQLKFSGNRSSAGQYMEGHKAWIERGFNEGIFLLVGSLKPEGGGGVIAYNTTFAELEARVDEDPFVTNDVVTADIVELAPARADKRLAFLVD